jgi:predicted aminopeptidase
MKKSRARRLVVGSLATLAVVSLVAACSPVYVLQMAFEQGRILWRRQPIEALLADPTTEPETAAKLRLVLEVRRYARERLGLRVGGSYATYSYVDRPALVYVLTAAPRVDLKPYTWWYLIVGRVPYKGFASEAAARAEAERFERAGYDTHLATSAAYSTLGWFDDPLMAHLLKYDSAALAEVIFHELLHNTLFVKGAVDFNESFANFVGNRAAIEFFRERSGESSEEYRRAVTAWENALEFSAFLSGVAASLAAVYAREMALEDKLKLKEEILAESQKEWARRISSRPRHRFRGYREARLNNAVLAHYLLYLRELALFEGLYEAEGRDLARTIRAVQAAVSGRADPFEAVRALLEQKQGAAIAS